MDQRVDELIESSKQVIRDSQVENGAIVAANTDKEYYPDDVANYRFVWPRDAAFTIYAEKLLGMDKLEAEFIEWLHDRAEGFFRFRFNFPSLCYQRSERYGFRTPVPT